MFKWECVVSLGTFCMAFLGVSQAGLRCDLPMNKSIGGGGLSGCQVVQADCDVCHLNSPISSITIIY